MEAYLEYLKEHNPEMAKYFELMQPMMGKNEVEEGKEIPRIDLEVEERIKKLKKINHKLFAMIENLKLQLEFELNQNDDLAKAIGACTECFGEDNECSACFGTGKPGNGIPDFILFNKYIQPAIQKYNKHYFNKN
ncbi:hypothetical protein [Flavobacterium geliluteum]|uniref:Uncharacterized protein n=1 Tax=Flavobacterium geliluteum TaxID=2816120 RepID=A0A940X4U1_9FLAO|nr:hypothetical protein [Flavobacterium geliluteum]MBP4136923.1 hypothetical protein [Flavobacterium geliluteum]